MLIPHSAYAPLFVVVSSALLYVSRGSITRPRSHGFYRFFAWECILGLVWVNLPVWGNGPFTASMLLADVLLAASVLLPLHAARMLSLHGQPGDERNDDTLISFEKTSTLVAAGAFRYIRHPMYTALMCLAWGIFLQQFTWTGLALVLAATALLLVTAFIEERECLAHFGQAYRDYMRRTRRFVPFVV